MNAKLIGASLVMLTALAVPAWAEDERKFDEIFKDVQEQVLSYPQFTIFDDVGAGIEDGVVTLVGKVTMPFKRDDIERSA